MNIKKILLEYQDLKYRDFISKLTNTKYEIFGIRVPILRKIAKELIKNKNYIDVIEDDIICYEHLFLKGFIIGYLKIDIKEKIKMLNNFIEYIDDWAICDCTASTIKINNKDYYNQCLFWLKSPKEFVCRFGIVSLMFNYIDEKYVDCINDNIKNINLSYYYVEMAIAWYIQKLYFKYKDKAIQMLNNNDLSKSIINKANQKIRDSIRERKYIE